MEGYGVLAFILSFTAFKCRTQSSREQVASKSIYDGCKSGFKLKAEWIINNP